LGGKGRSAEASRLDLPGTGRRALVRLRGNLHGRDQAFGRAPSPRHYRRVAPFRADPLVCPRRRDAALDAGAGGGGNRLGRLTVVRGRGAGGAGGGGGVSRGLRG